jgi:hypothetical protein
MRRFGDNRRGLGWLEPRWDGWLYMITVGVAIGMALIAAALR